jgi:hypothetical protein
MAIEFVAQRLQIGEVVLVGLPEEDEEWSLGELVTVVRGP